MSAFKPNIKHSLPVVILITTPLLGPIFGFGYEDSKVVFFVIGVILLGLIAAFTKFPNSKPTSIQTAVMLFFASLLLSTIFSIDPWASVIGKPPYYQGLLLYTCLILFYFFCRSTLTLNLAAKALALSGLTVSLLAVKDWLALTLFHRSVPLYAGRIVSSFGQPSFYAGFLLLCLPFVYHLYQKSKSVHFFLSTFYLFLIAIAISLSYSAIIIAGLFTIIFFIKPANYSKTIKALIIASLLTGAFFAQPFLKDQLWTEIVLPFHHELRPPAEPSDYSSEKRILIWSVALRVFINRPLTGYGLSNIDTAYQSIDYNQFKLIHPLLALGRLRDLRITSTHNLYLDLLISGGVITLLAFANLIFQLLKISHPILKLALLIYLCWSFFQLQSIVHLIFFWGLVAIIDKTENKLI